MAVTGNGAEGSHPCGPSHIAGTHGNLVKLLEAIFETVGESNLVEISEEILELPREERFNQSIDRFKTLYGVPEDKDLAEIGSDDLPPLIAYFLEHVPTTLAIDFLKSQLENSIENLYEELVNTRGGETDVLISSVFLEKLYRSVEAMEEVRYGDLDSEQSRQVISTFITIYSHFVLVSLGEREEFTEQLLRDVLWVDYYLARPEGEHVDINPAELELEEVESRILLEGAISAYDRLAISVGRGAELAGRPVPEFEECLLERGIQPDYGPKKGEQLLDGPGLSKGG